MLLRGTEKIAPQTIFASAEVLTGREVSEDVVVVNRVVLKVTVVERSSMIG